jgi:hypothetical protein
MQIIANNRRSILLDTIINHIINENGPFIMRGCGVVVSTSEHHAGGMGSNPTP